MNRLASVALNRAHSEEFPVFMTHWNSVSTDEALQQLSVAASSGLSLEEVEARQQRYGLNELIERGPNHAMTSVRRLRIPLP